MITCPYCNRLLTVRGVPAKGHSEQRPTVVQVTCFCGTVFELVFKTVARGTEENIEKARRPHRPPETYDEHGNRIALEKGRS